MLQRGDRSVVKTDEVVISDGIAGISAVIEARTAGANGVPHDAFTSTMHDYNAAIDRGAPFDSDHRDSKAATGITPPKSNWALPIEEPPYPAFAVVCGITFTIGGLKTDPTARVIATRDRVMPGFCAAGETHGVFFSLNYPGAASCLRRCVVGRRAGRYAAQWTCSTHATA